MNLTRDCLNLLLDQEMSMRINEINLEKIYEKETLEETIEEIYEKETLEETIEETIEEIREKENLRENYENLKETHLGPLVKKI